MAKSLDALKAEFFKSRPVLAGLVNEQVGALERSAGDT